MPKKSKGKRMGYYPKIKKGKRPVKKKVKLPR